MGTLIQGWDSVLEKSSQIQMNHGDPTTSGSVLSFEHADQLMMGNLAGTVNEHNQIENGAAASKSFKFLESECGSERKGVQLLVQKLSCVSSPTLIENVVDKESSSEPDFLDKQFVTEETVSIESIEKESIQEGPTFEKERMRTLSTGVEGLSVGDIIANHKKFNGGVILAQDSQVLEQVDNPNEEGSYLTDKEGGIGVISNDNIEVHQALGRSHSLFITRLGEYKHYVDLDDNQTTLLEEAIARYPNLWSVCERFSGRFQAWMLKTLADMLFFLRNESVTSVTPQRLKDFHRLCDEAAQLGFDRLWVDEMRRRAMDTDPKVDSARALLSELLQRHDQLSQELVEIKGEINRLNDFVAARKKCFDFL